MTSIWPDWSTWPVFGQILPKRHIWVQTPKWQGVNLWKRVVLEVQSLWKRGLPEWEAIVCAAHPATVPTKEFPGEIHVRPSAQDQSPGNSNITSIIYYFSSSTSSTFEIHTVLERNQNFSTASHSKTQQPSRGQTQPSATNCKRILESLNVPFCLSPVESDYQHIQSVDTRLHSLTHAQRRSQHSSPSAIWLHHQWHERSCDLGTTPPRASGFSARKEFWYCSYENRSTSRLCSV